MGCCEPRCPMNYHFMCARDANAVFQDDKKVYCEQHSYRARNEVCFIEILYSGKEYSYWFDSFPLLITNMLTCSYILCLLADNG